MTAANVTEPYWLASGFIVGAIFALSLFGVGEEVALAMVLVANIASLLSVTAIRAFTLSREGYCHRPAAGPAGTSERRPLITSKSDSFVSKLIFPLDSVLRNGGQDMRK